MQLTLPLQWPDSATFANFYGGDNLQAVTYLQQVTQISAVDSLYTSWTPVYLYGHEAVGLSHLLQASCHAVNQQGFTAAYLPVSKPELSPFILSGMENLTLVCIDDIESVVGDRNWEEALFHCYNRMQQNTVRLIIASHKPPAQLQWRLADLKSRLTACVVFQIKPLTDEQKILALQQRANARGFVLTYGVASYLLHHYSRTPHGLFRALEQLDQASLRAQRRLTIPFIKKVLTQA